MIQGSVDLILKADSSKSTLQQLCHLPSKSANSAEAAFSSSNYGRSICNVQNIVSENIKGYINHFCMNSKTGLGKADFKNTFYITIKREKHTGGWTSWTADLGEIEAFLSLWLYQVRLDNATSAIEAKEEEDEDEDHVVDQFIWAVAPLSAISCLDFDYWIRRSNYPFRIESQDIASKFIHFEGLRGLRSPQCENISGVSQTFGPKLPPFLLAMMTYATLPRFCGRYPLAGVVRQVLQYLSSLQGNTTFNGGTTPINSDSTTYKDTMIDSLAGTAIRTNLLTFQDAPAVIIPALRERGLLPSWPEENYDISGSTPGSMEGSMYAHLRTAGAMRRVGRWHVARIVLEHAAQFGGVENERDGLIERLKECTASNNALEEMDQVPGKDSLVPTHLSHLKCLLDEQHPYRLEILLCYRPSRNTLRNLLREAIDRGYYLPTLLIILGTLNDPHLKKLRSELKSLLYLLTQNQNNDVLKLLLLYTQRPIVIVEEHRNPLFYATKTGNIESIKLMLAAGISAVSRGNDGSTVLQTTAAKG